MNIGEFIANLNRFDLVVVLLVFGMFVLGFVQGTIRRILGLASMLFSFLFAANLRDPLGNYLTQNWYGFPDGYAVMLGFGIVFVAATVAFTLVIQGFYHKQNLFQKATFADELIAGALGIVQALFLVGCIIIILDTFFRVPGIPKSDTEFGWIRSLFDEMNKSGTADLFRSRLIPGFIAVFGLLIPTDIQKFFVTVPPG
ncbi:MAG TPA: CvpA family protein [Candidatus Limnocylindrales bacterium]|nr:CvpA family protein [Candidatus Limnocylindrales bacterium]